MEVSQVVQTDIDAKVAALTAKINMNNGAIAQKQAEIDVVKAENASLQELLDAYTNDVVANITVKAAPVGEVIAPVG